MSESATGNRLAAVGTALPETMIPVIAIVSVIIGRGDQVVANEFGVGAIRGAPFMLATIAIPLIGVTVLYFGNRRTAGSLLEADVPSLPRDLSFFLVGYSFAVVAAILPSRRIRGEGVSSSVSSFSAVFVRQTLSADQLLKGEDLDPLHLKRVFSEGKRPFPAFGSGVVPIDEPP